MVLSSRTTTGIERREQVLWGNRKPEKVMKCPAYSLRTKSVFLPFPYTNTDYILVKEEDFEKAMKALADAEYVIV